MRSPAFSGRAFYEFHHAFPCALFTSPGPTPRRSYLFSVLSFRAALPAHHPSVPSAMPPRTSRRPKKRTPRAKALVNPKGFATFAVAKILKPRSHGKFTHSEKGDRLSSGRGRIRLRYGNLFPALEGERAVSYTHLDVYKRQRWLRLRRRRTVRC